MVNNIIQKNYNLFLFPYKNFLQVYCKRLFILEHKNTDSHPLLLLFGYYCVYIKIMVLTMLRHYSLEYSLCNRCAFILYNLSSANLFLPLHMFENAKNANECGKLPFFFISFLYYRCHAKSRNSIFWLVSWICSTKQKEVIRPLIV